jgi:hypothetical protein
MVIVPDREDVVGFSSTRKLIVPSPAPLAPATTVIHWVLLAAVQLQPGAALTLTLPVPPAAGIH